MIHPSPRNVKQALNEHTIIQRGMTPAAAMVGSETQTPTEGVPRVVPATRLPVAVKEPEPVEKVTLLPGTRLQVWINEVAWGMA